MFTRYLPKSKNKLFALFMFITLTVSALYLYLNNLQEKSTVQSSGERCLTELSSLKYQLNEVTQYKDRIDKLLTETQKAHELDKERFKDIMESCVAMKQQSTICQSQFEDLQSECKKVRDDYNKLKKSLNI
ncbi:uncharacterized protein LOC114354104 [Ostrinia furnacalis]|uniref:uncharacterized protein LOC114354104 n=1 Tax=Ostrinia furnacalis TaxID=93504 RepID=UPI001038E8E2|nr:uncharacterized protein LOC114354104 [Ostrinia furnacalis]